MSEKQSVITPIIRLTFIMIFLICVVYMLGVTGVTNVLFKDKANGSLLYNDKNEVVGSALIGQKFTESNYFQGRVSSIDYNAMGSGSSNYGPSNPDLVVRTEESLVTWQKDNPTVPISQVPIDLVTNSASGLDPHISPEAAYAQVDRIAASTNLSKEKIKSIVANNTQGRELGMFGEERVNVLELNMDIQQAIK